MRKAFANLRILGLGTLVLLACSQQSALHSSPDAGKVDTAAPGPESGASSGQDSGVPSSGGAGASTAAYLDGSGAGGVTGGGGSQGGMGGTRVARSPVARASADC